MPIFIAKTYDNYVENIVLAKNIELAHAYWQGKKIGAHSVRELSEKDLIDHPTGVLPIIDTRMITAHISGFSNQKEIRVVNKG